MATIEQHERAYAKALEAGDTLAAYKIKQLAEDEQQARRKAQQEPSVAPSIDVTPEPGPTFLERTQDVIERRQQGIAETFERPMAIGKGVLDEEALSLEQKVLFTAGDVFGGIAEVGGDLLITGAEAITPDFVLEAIEGAVEAAQENPVVKEGLTLASQGIDKYQEWADNNRDTAKTLESYFNIGAFFTPATKLPPVKVGIEAIGKAGDTLEQRGGNLVRNGRSGILGKKRDKTAHMLEPAVKDIPAGDFDITPVVKTIKYDPKNPYKAQNIDIVNELPDVNPNKSYTYNAKVIEKAADAEKARLEGILRRTDTPFNPDEVMARVVSQTKEKLAELGELEPTAAKAINKALQQATKRLQDGDGSLLDILQARRDFDSYFNFQKAQNTQAGATLDSARTFARNAMNDVLEELSANSTVKSSLRKQSAYLNALDVIIPKRAKDGRLAVSRALKSIGRVLPTTVGAQVATAGLIAGGLATYWPLLTIPAIGALLFSGTRAAFSPQAKLVLGEIIKQSGKALKTAESKLDKEAIEQLRADRLVLISLLNETPVEKEEQTEQITAPVTATQQPGQAAQIAGTIQNLRGFNQLQPQQVNARLNQLNDPMLQQAVMQQLYGTTP
jgi:hypothetical protein